MNLQFDAQVQYYAKDLPVLCFRHAVKRALEGLDVQVEVVESSYLLARCIDCLKEEAKNEI